jgi:hypothetical protein
MEAAGVEFEIAAAISLPSNGVCPAASNNATTLAVRQPARWT